MSGYPKDWSCPTCGEEYKKGETKPFANYCCKELAWNELETAMENLRKAAEDYASGGDLDDFLKENGIRPLEEE